MVNWVEDEVAARWATFPLDAVPRPVVLLEDRVRIDGGFTDGESKMAWMDGAIRAHPSLPRAVSALLPKAGRAGEKSVLSITQVTATAAIFRCDRGPLELPAYRLQLTGLNGSCVILSPDVECWWSVAPSSLRRGAKIDNDGVTLYIPAFGGALTEFHGAEFQEYGTYVVGRAITSERCVGAGTAITAVGVLRRVMGRLTRPLGARPLLDTSGQPLSVTPKGKTHQ